MIKKITIAGAGTMGSSMAQIFAEYGYEVTLWNHRQPKLDAAKENMPKEDADKITFTTDLDAFKNCDLMVESVAEDLDVKLGFYRTISEVASDDAILATNTSGISINKLAPAVKKPERFLGMHWFNPPTLIPLIEIIKNDATSKETADAIYDLSLAIDKKPAVLEQDVPGFAANRLQVAVLREACHLVETGVISAEGIDAVMKYGIGFRWACLGPLETTDLGGIDIFTHVSDYLCPDLDNSEEIPPLLKQHYDAGELGVKTGKGFYDYSNGRGREVVEERDRKLKAVYNALYKK